MKRPSGDDSDSVEERLKEADSVEGASEDSGGRVNEAACNREPNHNEAVRGVEEERLKRVFEDELEEAVHVRQSLCEGLTPATAH